MSHSGSEQNSVSISISVDDAVDSGDFVSQLKGNASMVRSGSNGNSLRRYSRLSANSRSQLDEDEEDEIVSQAGDMGDRTLSRRGSQRGSGRVSAEGGVVFPTSASQVIPFSSDVTNPISKDADLHTEQEEKKDLPPSLEYIAYLVHLAFFGILGAIIPN